MITFQGRQQINNADIITRKAHTQYPHTSVSRVSLSCARDNVKDLFWGPMLLDMELKTAGERLKMEMLPGKLHRIIIESLKKAKKGNCYEESKLAELIGRINGQNNIYSGKVFINGNNQNGLDHEVAFITNSNPKPEKKYKFKNKEAIILDPWLGITAYAGDYFNKLKTIFKNMFLNLDNIENPDFLLEADFESRLTPQKMRFIKKDFPELIIKNYKKVKLA